MTPIVTDYPVFEADQVLSQKHLNKLISYLEEQDRVSRILLLGMGIVYGLEISRPNSTVITIECGTAITSLGYLIPFDKTVFTHYKDTTISENFLYPDLNKHPYLENVYKYAQRYSPFEACIELLETNANVEGRQLLTEDDLENKVVMLLLEAPLIDLKNCVAIDCDDKGKRLEFKIRPLLIDRNVLEDSDILLNSCLSHYLDPVALSKYNVPGTNLTTGQQVLDAFKTQIDKSKQKISEAIKKAYDYYAHEFNTLSNYSSLNNVLNKINTVYSQNKNNIYIQYVWDWIVDLAATYNEIANFNTCNPAVCCPVNDLFPFHVLLGMAEFETQEIHTEDELQQVRTPFIKTGALAEDEKDKKVELKGLIEKLILQLRSFDLNYDSTGEEGIKITPSLMGKEPLSKRAIPFYYDNIIDLNLKWSPQLTLKQKNHCILGYYSKLYNPVDEHVYAPLLFETEPYNFYRIEGHIGQKLDEALTEIIAQKHKYRLPFEVIALNAVDFKGKNLIIANQKAIWDDMELDYDLAKEKVYNITEYVISWIKNNKEKIQAEYAPMTDQAINGLEDILVESRSLLVDDLHDFLPNYEVFYEVFEKLNTLFLSHRLCISLFPELAEKSIIEDFVDHLDEINMLFLEDPFTIIHEEANRRWEAYFKETFLSNFLEKHTAITHRAGVQEGGTFIMVYMDNSVFKTAKETVNTTFLLRRIDNYMTLFKFDDSQKKKILEANVVRKRSMVKKKRHLTPEPDDNSKNIAKNLRNEVLYAAKRNIADLPKSTRDFMIDKIINAFDTRIPKAVPVDFDDGANVPGSNLPERKIIADFYLPYTCCSKGNNIKIVHPPADGDETIIADFDTKDFNDNDFFTIARE